MVRAFAAATGLSVMRYVRARRLSKAARALRGGAPDILSLALDADYGSHEAFTRAFRDHFGVTPEAVRAATCLDQLKLQEPIVMDSTLLDNLKPRVSKPASHCSSPASASATPLRNGGAGIPEPVAALSPDGRRASPAGSGRWPTASAATATMPEISTTSPASRSPTSPTCRANSPRADSGAEIRGVHPREHISTIRRTVNTIWNHWLPASGMKAADAPNFERYDEKFDPLTGNGGLEIWIPVEE